MGHQVQTSEPYPWDSNGALADTAPYINLFFPNMAGIYSLQRARISGFLKDTQQLVFGLITCYALCDTNVLKSKIKGYYNYIK